VGCIDAFTAHVLICLIHLSSVCRCHPQISYGKARIKRNKEYLRVTDILSNIVMSRPDYEFPQRLHAEIVSMVEKTANGRDESDFGELTYARAYIACYGRNTEKAVS